MTRNAMKSSNLSAAIAASVASIMSITGITSITGACSTNTLGLQEAQGVGDLAAGSAPKAGFAGDLVEACGPGALTRAGDERLVRTPYLQQMTDHSVQVLWTASEVANPGVTVTPAGGGIALEAVVAVDTTAAPVAATQLVATVEGLEPATIYCYEVRDDSGVLQSSTGFRTAPRTGSDAPVRFVAFGDLGQQTSDQFAVAEQLTTVEYDFAVVAGDIAYDNGELASFESFYFEVYADLIDRVPFFPASGNHDYATDHAGPYREVFSLPENGRDELYYSYDYGNLHVAIIDTETIDDEQLSWLDSDLALTEQPWKIVVGHRPPYSSGYHGSDMKVRNAFEPILSANGVQLAIFGHEHDYERVTAQHGVTYLVSGGGGRGTRAVGISDFTGYSEQVSHFVYIEVNGDALTVWAIDAVGKTFDTTILHNRG